MPNEVSQTTILLVIAGMAVANFGLRHLPMAALSRVKMPDPILRWLSFIPISVMGALVASEVLRPGGKWVPPLTNPAVYAALVTGVVFRFTRSFLGATAAGVLSFLALRGIM